MFLLFFCEVKSDNAMYNQAIFFLTIDFIAFNFIVLFDLNSNLNNFIEMLSVRIF